MDSALFPVPPLIPSELGQKFDLERPISVYADGSCQGNPGPGGWAIVLIQPRTDQEQALFLRGKAKHTTNNRMELTAVLAALKLLHPAKKISFHLDSQYVLKGITEWLPGWKAKNWTKADKKPVLNLELWQKLDQYLVQKGPSIEWHWIKGHAGDKYNEICDQLAKSLWFQPK